MRTSENSPSRDCMISLCRSRTELSRKDLMGEHTHYLGPQASTKSTRGAAL
jgi:hypothetical protein